MQALLDLIKQSPLWQEAEAEGEAKGEAKGEARARSEGFAAQRATILKLMSRHHQEILAQALPRIEGCDDPVQLEAWILAASEPDSEVLARLLATPPDAH